MLPFGRKLSTTVSGVVLGIIVALYCTGQLLYLSTKLYNFGENCNGRRCGTFKSLDYRALNRSSRFGISGKKWTPMTNCTFTANTVKDDFSEPYMENLKRINKRRLDRVNEFCNSVGGDISKHQSESVYQRENFTRWVWLRSRRHCLFYCAAPKCGSTTWKRNLMEDMGVNVSRSNPLLNIHTSASKLMNLSDFLLDNSLSVWEYIRYFKDRNRLLITRNPWTRIVSTYLNKIVLQKWRLERLCLGWEQYESVTNVTFKEFLDCVLQRRLGDFVNSHIDPITSLCALCTMEYTLIVRQEDLSKGSSHELFLRKSLGMNIDFEPYKRRNFLQVSTSKIPYSRFYEDVPSYDLERFRRIYKYDILLFGYPNSPFD